MSNEPKYRGENATKRVVFNPQGQPRWYDDETREAMRIVEGLMDEGLIALAPDHWLGGKVRFMPPHIAARNLHKSLEDSAKVEMTAEDRREQRISWIHGQTGIPKEFISRFVPQFT